MQVIRMTVFFLLIAVFAKASDFTPALSDAQMEEIRTLLESKPENKEAAEQRYQEVWQEQSLSDLLQVYEPTNQDKIQITYASFTPATAQGGGDDLGFGLHIVKRLIVPLSNGKTKTIDVNELWDEDKMTGGLFLPDEIRIKVQVADEIRYVPGSEKNYFFDQYRVAWGVGAYELKILRRTKYTYQNGVNRVKAMRVPISAPYSCKGCHRPTSSLAKAFLQEGETRNYEAIVQNSHFLLKPEEMRGFKQYIGHLKSSGKKPAFVDAAIAKMKDIRHASQVPGLYEEIKKTLKRKERSWMVEDSPVYDSEYLYKNRQGVYKNALGKLMMDPIEEVFEGKYRWWEPQVFIP